MCAQTAFSRLRYRPAANIAVDDRSGGLRYRFSFPFGILQFYWSVLQLSCSTDSIATDTRNMRIPPYERSDGLRPPSLPVFLPCCNAAILLASPVGNRYSIAAGTRNTCLVPDERSDGLRPPSLSLFFDFCIAAILLVSFIDCL